MQEQYEHPAGSTYSLLGFLSVCQALSLAEIHCLEERGASLFSHKRTFLKKEDTFP